MKHFILFMLMGMLSLNAYCISNETEQDLYFMVEFYPEKSDSILTFKKNIKPKDTLCCDNNDKSCNPIESKNKKVSFYAFLNEDSLEGCDIFGTINSHITLKTYAVFDNCIWK